MKTLFILKRRCNYGEPSYPIGFTSGLYNSAKFVSDMLEHMGIESKVVEVVDNNSIDGEVASYKPTHVFIEALWVVPSKFEVLQKLHPMVKWVVRIHSNVPFLANEGIAIDWIKGYAKFGNVRVAPNSRLCMDDLRAVIPEHKLVYLPNYYQFEPPTAHIGTTDDTTVRIGCFGAIRPLKNQLIQAIAAIRFAATIGKKLEFHINSSRVEQKGCNVLKNLRALFSDTPDRVLVEHKWLPRSEFLAVIGSMDINMQVSFTETFNIVAADSVNEFVPVIVSDSIGFILPNCYAFPTDGKNISDRLLDIWTGNRKHITHVNWLSLQKANLASARVWIEYMISSTMFFGE
jgi:hypothetical protein